MTEIRSLLKSLTRPRLLIRAARFGLPQYKRDRDLERLVPGASRKGHIGAIRALLAEEIELETARKMRDATYSAERHIALLIAIMGEAELSEMPEMVEL